MKRTRSDRIVDVIIAVVVTFICILCLYPMLHVLAASFSDPMRLMNHQGIMLWPDGWSLDGYKAIMRNKGLWTGYLNTIIYVVFGTAINMVMTIIGTPNLALWMVMSQTGSSSWRGLVVQLTFMKKGFFLDSSSSPP